MKTKYLLVILALSSLIFYACNTTDETQSQEKASFIAKFYPLEESTTVQEKHPLVFLFGGSEGGMPYQKSDKTCIDDLHKKGYHVVTVAYFNYKNLPKDLNRIPLDGFKKTLEQYRHLPSVDPQAIAVIGTSKGGELVLNLASIYPQIHSVAAIVPSFVTFQASNISLASHSSWMYNNKELDFVPYPIFSLAALEGVLTGKNYRNMHILALENKQAVKKARIKVENIHGAIYLVSGRHDHMWPSMEMSEEIIKDLKKQNFRYGYSHKTYNTNHFVMEAPGAWEGVLNFLESEKNRLEK